MSADPSPLFVPWRDEEDYRDPFRPKPMNVAQSGAGMGNVIRKARLRVVEGRGDFPIDMLRYDRAFVLTPIPHPHHSQYPRRGQLRVVVGFWATNDPTVARWRSFGWKVLDVKIPTAQADTLKAPRHLQWQGRCLRCGTFVVAYTMSYFNRDLICGSCEDEERTHPDFQLATATDRHAIKSGDFNFAGIGWPGVGNRVPG